MGDPPETGLLRFTADFVNIGELRQQYRKIGEEPFTSETKIMSTLHHTPEGLRVYSQGAAESILETSTAYFSDEEEKPFSQGTKAAWLKRAEQESANGWKVIAFLTKETPTPKSR